MGHLGALICILLGTRTPQLAQHFLSFLQRCKAALGAAKPRFHVTFSTSLPASLPLNLLYRLRNARRPLSQTHLQGPLPLVLSCCFFLSGILQHTSRGSSDLEVSAFITTQAAASSLRQTDNYLGAQAWQSRALWEGKLKPGFSSSRRLTEGVLLFSENWRLE